jgi:predicted phosphodiesterase
VSLGTGVEGQSVWQPGAVKIGLMSDIHGNRHALEAVVADAAGQGVSRWWVLGDLVAIGPDPVATLELIANLPGAEIISGNTERYVLTDDRPPPHPDAVIAEPDLLPLYGMVQRSFAWTGGAVAAHGWLSWLRELPLELRAVLPDGTTALGVHASPGKDDGDGITPLRSEEELRRDLVGAQAHLVFAGHTHQPTDRLVAGVRAVNLGSVSNPITDDLRASYVVVNADRHGHGVEHRRVSYDREGFLHAIARSGHPASDYIASFQRGEQVRYPARRPGAPDPTA